MIFNLSPDDLLPPGYGPSDSVRSATCNCLRFVARALLTAALLLDRGERWRGV